MKRSLIKPKPETVTARFQLFCTLRSFKDKEKKIRRAQLLNKIRVWGFLVGLSDCFKNWIISELDQIKVEESVVVKKQRKYITQPLSLPKLWNRLSSSGSRNQKLGLRQLGSNPQKVFKRLRAQVVRGARKSWQNSFKSGILSDVEVSLCDRSQNVDS